MSPVGEAGLWPWRRASVKAGAMTNRDEERARRLAEALRDNLRRRKAQARAEPSAEPAVGDGDRHRDGDEDAD